MKFCIYTRKYSYDGTCIVPSFIKFVLISILLFFVFHNIEFFTYIYIVSKIYAHKRRHTKNALGISILLLFRNDFIAGSHRRK
jgi:hypothetical protein